MVLGWDSSDQLYDNVSFTGWHTAYPDAQCAILPETCRALPLESDMLLFLAEFAGPAEALCPRGSLKRVLERAKSMGYSAQASAEYEFFLFEETPHSVREKNFRNLRTITPGYFGYSLLRASVHAEFHEDLLKLCEALYTDPSDPRGVEEWGKILGMSGRTLARRFEEEVGISLRTWRRRLRLFKAIELLAGDRSITEIALELGYGSSSAFTYAFRTEMGRTQQAHRLGLG